MNWKRIIGVIVLTAMILLSFIGCTLVSSDKATIYYTDGTSNTVYNLNVSEHSFATFYLSKEDSEAQKGQITVPMTSIKSIVNHKE